MARKASIEKNKKIEKMIRKYAVKRAALKEIIYSSTATPQEKFEASLKLAALPRNSSPTRYRLRCEITGRPRGNYKKFKLSRNKFRELASAGLVPGVLKSSW